VSAPWTPAPTPFDRLLGHVVAVGDLDAAVTSFESIGLRLRTRERDGNGATTTARFPFADDGYLDVVAVTDPDHPDAAAITDFLGRGGDGLWRTDIAVEDLEAIAAEFEARDEPAAATLGPVREGADGERRRAVQVRTPSALGGAHFDLVEGSGVRAERESGTWWKRIFTEAVAVPSIDLAIEVFANLGQKLWDRSGREDWGIDTAVFRQSSGSNVEFVAPADASRPTAAAISSFIARRGGGHYMPVYEVDDIDAVYGELTRRGVRTLGPPTVAPPESPWGPVRQMWVHPKLTHGAFVEFLSVAT
jgi:hypothetical protein